MVAVDEGLGVDRAIFQERGGVWGEGAFVVDGVYEVGVEISGGFGDDECVVAIAAADGFVADGVDAGEAEVLDQQAGDVGFADAGVGSGDEDAHAGGVIGRAVRVKAWIGKNGGSGFGCKNSRRPKDCAPLAV